ncbi:MAG: hypothetical protein L0Y56_06055 [Nitrospira sp.]|nr:hypothetical protein [Nitrospira sp.]
MNYNSTCPSDFTCPNGHSGDIVYLEDLTSFRRINGYAEDGTLLVEGFYETEGFDEQATNPRFCCEECGEEFPIPDEVEIDFV